MVCGLGFQAQGPGSWDYIGCFSGSEVPEI